MKVILATDGSPCSEVAVKEVATRRWPAGTQVKVLSVAIVPRPNAPDPLHIVDPMRLKLLEREQSRLRDLVTRSAAWLRDNAVEKSLQIETAVVEGEPKVVIIEEAEQWGGRSHRSRVPRLWACEKVSARFGLARRGGPRTVFGRNRKASPSR